MPDLRRVNGGGENAERWADIKAIVDEQLVPVLGELQTCLAAGNLPDVKSSAVDLRIGADAIVERIDATPQP